MSSKYKIIGIMMATLVMYAFIDLCILRFGVYPEFAEIEHREALADTAGCKTLWKGKTIHTGEALGKAILGIRSDIPIILCTGFSERITQEQAQAMGFRGFIMKPMKVRQIAGIVRGALDSHAGDVLD